MTRSSTGGMPNVRTPPPLFGTSAARTGVGWDVPASSCARMAAQLSTKYVGSSSPYKRQLKQRTAPL